MESKFRLKDRLINLFRRPALLFSTNCGGCRSTPARKEKKNNKKEIRVRENGKLYITGERVDQEGRTCPPTSPSSPSKNRTIKQKKKKKMMMMMTRAKRCELFSSSAMESVDDFGFFSSHEEREEACKEEDIETFFSSRSFSSDSSDFYKKAKKVKSFTCRRPPLRRREKKRGCIWVDDGFQPLVSICRRREEEEEEAGFAVMKKSTDPYGDFQSSMMEMIVQRQIFGAGELQWLLNSYLSLNSVQNHPVILKAFVDISQVLFGY